MNPKSFLKKFFLGGEVLEKVYSSLNGEITIVESLSGYKEMRIGGVTQSGGLVEKLWGEGLKEILKDKDKILSVLILGLGCGTAARLVSEKWPWTKIAGVEIDPIVVELGKKYFGLGKISNLEIFVADAIKLVDLKYKINNTKYNLILVDLYVGKEFPKEAESGEFLNGLRKVLAEGGIIIFNRLYYNRGHQKRAEEFLRKVKNIFSEVTTQKLVTNLLIFASN